MYLRCPLQYYFRYVCGLKMPPTGDMTLGRTVHGALEDIYRQKIESGQDLPLDRVCDSFSDRWENEAQLTLFQGDESAGHLKDEGVRLLGVYHSTVAPTVQPAEVEREFLVDTGATELPLKGYIDLIDSNGTIIDHKTTKRSFPQDAAQKDLQLTAYAMAYRQLYGQPENGLRLDALVRNKQPKVQQLATARSQADVDRFLRLAGQVERAIKAEAFYPSDNYMCGVCGYGEMCGEW
jgi:putative RecB family exonuclease